MKEKSDPMLPYHCFGLDQFRCEYEALARVDSDGVWYKRDEVDAEVERLTARVAELEMQSRGNWIDAEQLAQEIERLRAERDRLAGALAVCGVVAREGDGTCLPDYETDSVIAVRKLRSELARWGQVWDALNDMGAGLGDANKPLAVTASWALLRNRACKLDTLLREALTELRHTEVFISSRQKMHPDGIKLFRETMRRIDAVLSEMEATRRRRRERRRSVGLMPVIYGRADHAGNMGEAARVARRHRRGDGGAAVKRMLGEGSLSTTEVCALLGLHLSVDQLKACGVAPFVETAQGTYWRKQDLPLIARAVALRVDSIARRLERGCD